MKDTSTMNQEITFSRNIAFENQNDGRYFVIFLHVIKKSLKPSFVCVCVCVCVCVRARARARACEIINFYKILFFIY